MEKTSKNWLLQILQMIQIYAVTQESTRPHLSNLARNSRNIFGKRKIEAKKEGNGSVTTKAQIRHGQKIMYWSDTRTSFFFRGVQCVQCKRVNLTEAILNFLYYLSTSVHPIIVLVTTYKKHHYANYSNFISGFARAWKTWSKFMKVKGKKEIASSPHIE